MKGELRGRGKTGEVSPDIIINFTISKMNTATFGVCRNTAVRFVLASFRTNQHRRFNRILKSRFVVSATLSHAVPFQSRVNFIESLPETPQDVKLTTVLPYLTRLVLSDSGQYWRALTAMLLILLSKATGLYGFINITNSVFCRFCRSLFHESSC